MVLPKVANAITSLIPISRIHQVQAPNPAFHSHFCLETATDGLLHTTVGSFLLVKGTAIDMHTLAKSLTRDSQHPAGDRLGTA